MHRRHRCSPRLSQPVRTFASLAMCEPLEQRFALSVSWAAGTWRISGDADAAHSDDTIVVERSPADPQRLQAVVNGVVVGSRIESTVKVIRIHGGKGDDAITVDIPGNTRIRTILIGGDGDDVMHGGDGDDTIRGRDGNDTIIGGAGDDTIFGGTGDDSAGGSDGDDTLHGGNGADTLRGGGGSNLLDGGGGTDALFGTPGVDRVRRAAGEQLIGNESTNPLRRVDDAEQLKAWYIDTALAQWGSQLGQETGAWWRDRPTVLEDAADSGTVSALAGQSNSADHSGTNNQVAGVDESDMVKTDGQHLFVLAGDGVDIVNAWPADELGVVSHVATPGYERGLFLSGSRLTVISQEDSWQEVTDETSTTDRLASWGGVWQSSVVVTVIDVSAAAAPAIVETTRLDGWLVDARAIEGRVLVVTQASFDIPTPALIPLETDEDAVPPSLGSADGDAATSAPLAMVLPPVWTGDGGDGGRYAYEDAASYRARLETAWASSAVPSFRVTSAAGETTGDLVAPGHAYVPVEAGDNTMLSVVSFEVSDDHAGPDAVTSVAGVSGSVYASTSSLYISATHWGTWWDVTDSGTTTNIYKFDLQHVDAPLVAMGAVPGVTLNQFSLDESADGLLRVATTDGFGDAASNGVFVLTASAGNLQTIGSVTGLAAGERIYSVRFIDAVGYVSTFRQIDPLFTIDLADPTAPRVVGELKVPGFSSYLHPLDATHLLGVGRDVDPDTGRVLGLQLSIFDVGDPADPRRTATYTFPGDGWESWSEALWDHHALSWFADQRILALPVQEGNGWDGGSGLVVFEVDLDSAAGFTRLGQIDHDGAVQRSVRIGDFLYSVSAGEVRVHRIDDPTVEVAAATLAPPADEPVAVAW